jgi:hypothetical protein
MSVPSLVLGYRHFLLSRRGHSPAECEDAAAADPERGRFAVADGAAESSFAALWARLLVQDFVLSEEPPERLPQWLPAVQQRWEEAVRQSPAAASLPWYLEAGVLRGAFATFLGLALDGSGWQAVAVGDSCLFQVRQGSLLRAFPLARAADFGNAPWLVGSRTSAAEVPGKKAVRGWGEWEAGDRLWLMTDALAHWFLERAEAGGRPWDDLELVVRAPAAEAAFATWVERLRDARELRNDDVTLMALAL